MSVAGLDCNPLCKL